MTSSPRISVVVCNLIYPYEIHNKIAVMVSVLNIDSLNSYALSVHMYIAATRFACS